MSKKSLHPEWAARVMWAYSHGISVDVWDSQMIFVTGQIAMDADGNAISPDDIEKQAHFVFISIRSILGEAWSSLDDVVKTVIYVTNMEDFAKISPIRNIYFERSKPASNLVEISRTVKEGCDIEVDVIAIKKK